MQSFVRVPTSPFPQEPNPIEAENLCINEMIIGPLWPRNSSFPSAQQHRWTRIPRISYVVLFSDDCNSSSISAGIVPDSAVINRFPPQGQAISCVRSLLKDTYCLFQNSGNGLKELWF
ncbi:hypothetical protein V6N13_101191 [Hibiscus sabdariffa]|uniref:Uncharacterized protein n=1 Tax=Hibiscus sabdariffa TaxID=183260 RepID=A0ABR2QKN5_9ROSI